jgi:hypothetical protein
VVDEATARSRDEPEEVLHGGPDQEYRNFCQAALPDRVLFRGREPLLDTTFPLFNEIPPEIQVSTNGASNVGAGESPLTEHSDLTSHLGLL